MSAVHNPVQHEPLAVQASLNRLNLLYRFDLRQRTWVLQALEIRSEKNSLVPAGLAALAADIAKNISDISDPSLGGDKHPKTATRRIGIRHFLRRSSGKTKTTTKEK